MGDFERSKLPHGVAVVKANLPGLGLSSRIISRRQLFGRNSQRSRHISIYMVGSAEKYMPAGIIGFCSAATIASWVAVFRGELQGDWELHDFIQRNFFCSLDNFKSGRWWAMLTCSFEHVQPEHLLLNMWALWGIGRHFIGLFGASAFLKTWLFSAITGSLGTIYWLEHMNSDHTVIGAHGSSTALCGLLSAESVSLLLSSKQPTGSAPFPFSRQPVYCFGAFAASVFCLYYDCLPSIGHAGHLGGMAGGVAAYFLFIRWIFRR